MRRYAFLVALSIDLLTSDCIDRTLTLNFVASLPRVSYGQKGLQKIPYRNCRQRCHIYPIAGLRRWISQNFPFRNDGNSESNEFKRPLYDSATQNRWKNAINQLGIGTGLTEEEKAEAARIRRARLVAQDPLYTQRLMGTTTASNVVQTQQQGGASRLQERMQKAKELLQLKLQGKVKAPSSTLGDGTWGEIHTTDTFSEQQARKERSARLQQDAARTLGERAKYFVVEGHGINRDQETNKVSNSEQARSAPPTPPASTNSKQVKAASSVGPPPAVRASSMEVPSLSQRTMVDKARTTILGTTRTEKQGKFENVVGEKQRAQSSGRDVMSDWPNREEKDLLSMPARDLLSLPVLLEDVREVAEESVWKVIAPKGVMVMMTPEDWAEPLGRLRGMQMVEVELAVGPWLKLKKTDGWVRAQGGTRGLALSFEGIGV